MNGLNDMKVSIEFPSSPFTCWQIELDIVNMEKLVQGVLTPDYDARTRDSLEHQKALRPLGGSDHLLRLMNSAYKDTRFPYRRKHHQKLLRTGHVDFYE